MTQDEIRAIAQKVAKEFTSPDGENNDVIYSQHIEEFATRFLAAIAENVEPVAWGIEISGEPTDVWLNKDNLEREFNRRQEKYPDATRKFVALYTHPAIEPAPLACPFCGSKSGWHSRQCLNWKCDPETGEPIRDAACAAPLPDEVREMVERLRIRQNLDVELCTEAAYMIERLAKQVQDNADDLTVAYMAGASKAVPPDCVVVQRKVTEEAKCVLATQGNYRTYQDQWTALIAAGGGYAMISPLNAKLDRKWIEASQRIAELEAALATRSKQIGVACLKHDIVHSLVCGICFSELEQQRDELLAALHAVRLKTDPKYGWPIIDAAIDKVNP